MSSAESWAGTGVPAEISARIRAGGAVVDMSLTHSMYALLLSNQRRDGVVVTNDVAYGGDERHRLDIYRPADPGAALLPVMLFLHGGGFVRGDKSEKDNIGYYFARSGRVVMIANYRLAPAAVWPAGAEDAVAAHAWACANASRYGGDPQRIFLVGESAGAAHVAAATLVRRFHPPHGLAIAGAVLISGLYDVELERLARRQFGVATPDPRNEPYFGADRESYALMSTVRIIDAAPVPLLITYAELDPPQMQVQAGELFAALVTRHGFEPELLVVPGHNHLSQVYSINTGDESLSHAIGQFLRKHS
jgi:acetyl esterase